MSLKKRLKKKVRKLYNKGKEYVNKVTNVVAKVDPVVGALTGGKESSDTRSDAAAALVKKNRGVTKQGGGGQVNFSEDYFE